MTIRATHQRSAAPTLRAKGYGIAIDFLDGYPHDARLLDQSPVLFPEKVVRSGFEEDGHRRFGFVEFAGQGEPPASGLLRYVGDAFFVDRRVAEFVWQACIEKIENDAEGRATPKDGAAFVRYFSVTAI